MKLLLGSVFPSALLLASTGAAQIPQRYAVGAPVASLASYPDIDGDGVLELLVGAPNPAAIGAVQVRSGASGVLLRTIAGPAAAGASASFGQSLANAGDVNGDGVADILVGDPYAGTNGLAFLFSPRGYNLLIGGTGFKLIGTFVPPMVNGGFCAGQPVEYGLGVAGLGDLNGDGLGEIAVGAPSFSLGALVCARTGYVNVISPVLAPGFPPALPPAVIAGPASITLFPPIAVVNKRFGQSITAMGDVNGDGVGEVVIAAPRVSVPTLGGSTDVLVYDGATLLAGGIVPFARQTDVNDFGLALAALPDIDGNSLGELAIGTGNTLNDLTPCVSVVTGKNLSAAAGVIPPAMVTVPMATAPANPAVGCRLGYALASIPDFNGDGIADLLAGARSIGTAPQGEAFVLDPRSFAVLGKATPGAGANQGFGSAVTSLGTDAFGAPIFAVADPMAAMVFVF